MAPINCLRERVCNDIWPPPSMTSSPIIPSPLRKDKKKSVKICLQVVKSSPPDPRLEPLPKKVRHSPPITRSDEVRSTRTGSSPFGMRLSQRSLWFVGASEGRGYRWATGADCELMSPNYYNLYLNGPPAFGIC